MFVVRGSGDRHETDRRVAEALLDQVTSADEPGVRVWTPFRQVAFGPRDTAAAGYPRAAAAARERGFPPTERTVGGRPVAMTGSTVAFTRGVPVDDVRRGLTDRYERTREQVRHALAGIGVETTPGEPPDSFCPGQHALSAEGKLVGFAQRVTTGAAAVSGVIVTTDHEEIADVLTPVYRALGVPFDPTSVDSLERAGGAVAPEGVISAVERELVGRSTPREIGVVELLDGGSS